MSNRIGGWRITTLEPAQFTYMCYAGDGCTYPPRPGLDPNVAVNLTDLVNYAKAQKPASLIEWLTEVNYLSLALLVLVAPPRAL